MAQPQEDNFTDGYHQMIDLLLFTAGTPITQIKIASEEEMVDLTPEDLATHVFPGSQVSFEYPYHPGYHKDKECCLVGDTYVITTGTTLKEVLMPLVMWGLGFKTACPMSFDGFIRTSPHQPWTIIWSPKSEMELTCPGGHQRYLFNRVLRDTLRGIIGSRIKTQLIEQIPSEKTSDAEWMFTHLKPLLPEHVEQPTRELLDYLVKGAQIWYHKTEDRYLIKEFDSNYYNIDSDDDDEFVLAIL